jgi:hypothetical protein
MEPTHQYEVDRENEAVGPDYPYDPDFEQPDRDEPDEDEASRERIRLLCTLALLELGMVPHYLGGQI